MAAPAGLQGVFLNLGHSAARRAAMEGRLAAAGLGWVRRHAAVDGRPLDMPPGCLLAPAQLGCLASHLAAIETAAPPDHWLLVLEDDAVPAPQLADFLQPALLDALAGRDLALLDCQPDCSLHTMAQLWGCLQRHLGPDRRAAGLDFVAAAGVFRWGLSAYLVSPRGRQRLAAVHRANLAAGPVLPNDQAVRQAIEDGRLDAVVLLPFLATVEAGSHADSTIGAPAQQDVQALASVLRHLLFAGPVEDLHGWAGALLARQPAGTPEQALAARVLGALFALDAAQGGLQVSRAPPAPR